MSQDADARRLARGGYTVRIYRAGEEARASRDDALDWDRIPLQDRAAYVWQLSLEVHALAYPTAPPISQDFHDLLFALSAAEARTPPG